jgi:hypothetical protein
MDNKVQEIDIAPSGGCGLPRLMQNEAVVLCGIDIPEVISDGKLRVIVALKRVWHDAPRDIALIVRNLLPSGERRAAVIYRSLGEEAEAVGLEVPMAELGIHELAVQIAKNVDGELIEVCQPKFVPSLKRFLSCIYFAVVSIGRSHCQGSESTHAEFGRS